MQAEYQARWVSKERAETVRREGWLGQGMLLDTLYGYIVVEPVGAFLGDGAIISRREAHFELQEPWYTGPKATLKEARKRLGLDKTRALAKQ